MLSKRYDSTEVDRRTWLHVLSGTPWSTLQDTHQEVVTKKETYTYMYTPVGTRGLSRECVLRIPMRVVKGD